MGARQTGSDVMATGSDVMATGSDVIVKPENDHRPRDIGKTALLTISYKIHQSFNVLGSVEDLMESLGCKESLRGIQRETKIG